MSASYRAYCENCQLQTEERHSEESARELCESHNERSRADCEAEPVPLCWVCFDHATHRDETPPHEFVCEEHVLSIDAVPIEEWGGK